RPQLRPPDPQPGDHPGGPEAGLDGNDLARPDHGDGDRPAQGDLHDGLERRVRPAARRVRNADHLLSAVVAPSRSRAAGAELRVPAPAPATRRSPTDTQSRSSSHGGNQRGPAPGPPEAAAPSAPATPPHSVTAMPPGPCPRTRV